jgi:hypothetical protein
MRQDVSRHIKCTMKRTLLNSTLDKTPEVALEVPYRPTTNEEADVHVTSDSDAGQNSNKTSKLEVSAIYSKIQYCIPEPAPGKTALSTEEAPPKVDSTQSAIELAKSAAKLTLKTVKEVSDAFPPLKFVAAGLSLIVENAEVCNCVNLLFILTAHVTAYVVSKR